MKIAITSLLSFVVAASVAQAADAPTSSAAAPSQQTATPPPQVNVSATVLPSFAAPEIGPVRISAGGKFSNTAGRTKELAKKDGRRYKMKNEFYLGGTHKSGWGVSAMMVQAGESFGDERKDHYAAGDPSLTVVHPKIFETPDVKVWGQFRRYFAATERSLNRHQEQYAYYSYLAYSMPHGLSLFNQLTPRYFKQDFRKAADTTYFVEDYTALTKKVNNWFKYGVGQHAQMEWHENTERGTVVEAYPFIDIVLSNNLFIEPRVYMPIYKSEKGSVYDAPTAVNTDNTQFEIYMQASI